MALRIAIEGNISAGKSTLLSILSKELDFLVVPEPVDKWQSIDNDNEDDAALGLQSESQESGMNLLVCCLLQLFPIKIQSFFEAKT